MASPGPTASSRGSIRSTRPDDRHESARSEKVHRAIPEDCRAPPENAGAQPGWAGHLHSARHVHGGSERAAAAAMKRSVVRAGQARVCGHGCGGHGGTDDDAVLSVSTRQCNQLAVACGWLLADASLIFGDDRIERYATPASASPAAFTSRPRCRPPASGSGWAFSWLKCENLQKRSFRSARSTS
jgi:hypothetical protein